MFILRDNHKGMAIFRGDYVETLSSVDNVQLLSSINPHDGTVTNETLLQCRILLAIGHTTAGKLQHRT